MLILAGVSISAIVGEDGIITKAITAKLSLEDSARQEELEDLLFTYNADEIIGDGSITNFLGKYSR